MNLVKYPEYKDSGVEWIGNIPKHWDVRSLKHLAKTIAGGTPSTLNLDYWENGDIPWLPSGLIQNKDIFKEDVFKYITELGLYNSSTKYIGPFSVLIALTGATCANIGFLNFKATANQSVISIEPFKDLPRFFYYYLLSQKEQILINKSGGAQGGINEEHVKSLKILELSFNEQKQIANYLDNKIAKIDEVIENNQKLIELLEEKRITLINQVVTKGLNPDVEMKDSRIEWIGEIPEHWGAFRIKDYLNFNIGGTPPTKVTEYFEGENIWISIADINSNEGDVISDSSVKISDEAIRNSNVKLIHKGSLLYSFKLSVGLTAFAGCDLYTNEAIASFEPNEYVDLNFLKYVFNAGFENNANVNIYGAKLFNSDLECSPKLIFDFSSNNFLA